MNELEVSQVTNRLPALDVR